jgi:hypothetical protein
MAIVGAGVHTMRSVLGSRGTCQTIVRVVRLCRRLIHVRALGHAIRFGPLARELGLVVVKFTF